MGQWFKSNVHISNLPEKLIIQRASARMDGDDDDEGDGLGSRDAPLPLSALFGGDS